MAVIAAHNIGATEANDLQSENFPEPFLDEDETYVLKEPLYAYFNHNSDTWDTEKSTFTATVRLNEMVVEHDIPVISNVESFDDDDEPVENHFLGRDQITYPVQSSNGEHRLFFPKVRVMIMSGGYLEQCLRRAMRDVYRGARPYTLRESREPLRLYLVADAVYALASHIRSATKQQQNPEGNGPSEYPLREAMAFMSDEAVADYVKDQMSIEDVGYDPKEVRLRIFRGDREIHMDEHGKYEVDIILIDTRMLREKLPSIVRSVEA
ncbi:MAG: hypothetical protein ACOC0A_01660 [Planctomycetota bacterium]